MVLLVYVDDVLLTSNNLDEIQILKKFLDDQFTIKDLGEAKYILGLEIATSQRGISINQRKYALDILEDSSFSGCKPVAFPMDSTFKLKSEDCNILSDPSTYRRLIGRMIYLTITRPDLAYSVQVLS